MIDVAIYAASLLLEFAVLIVLRLREPRMRRPYRVPGGWLGLLLVSLSSVFVVVLAVAGTLHDEGPRARLLAAGALLTGPLLYPVLRVLVKRQTPDVAVPVELTPEPRGPARPRRMPAGGLRGVFYPPAGGAP